jgi:hypothetical protein
MPSFRTNRRTGNRFRVNRRPQLRQDVEEAVIRRARKYILSKSTKWQNMGDYETYQFIYRHYTVRLDRFFVTPNSVYVDLFDRENYVTETIAEIVDN